MKITSKGMLEKISPYPLGAENIAYAQYFTGECYLAMLTTGKTRVGMANVSFAPSCRNSWHIHHGGGQILIVTAGEGWYQESGKKAQHLKMGDIVEIPPEVKHWHGAAKDSWFAHIAVEVPAENATNEWCERVSDKDYDALEE